VTVVGIDPGLSGAICRLDAGGIEVVDMPCVGGDINAWELARIICDFGPVDRVAVEAVHSMPRQGVASSFKFGHGCGVIEGILATLERPVVFIAPSVWVPALHLPKGGPTPAAKKAAKDARRRRAMEMWPDHAAMFARVKDDGRADAALLASWAAAALREPAAA
jgi:crossover junction endodeoxyribonuclease RuvC